MTQSQNPPTDPDTVAEIAPGEGPGAGSVEYGGSEIHSDDVDADRGGPRNAGDQGVTTEAGTFEDLPVSPEEQTE
jgi:hypothetical protein